MLGAAGGVVCASSAGSLFLGVRLQLSPQEGGHLRPLFRLGAVVITANAHAALDRASVMEALSRHSNGDWGALCDEDRDANERALNEGGRLLSAYADSAGTAFWIITECDRSATTVLLPQDY